MKFKNKKLFSIFEKENVFGRIRLKKNRFQNCIQKNFSPVTKIRLSPPSNKILAENLAVFAGILLPNDAREKNRWSNPSFRNGACLDRDAERNRIPKKKCKKKICEP